MSIQIITNKLHKAINKAQNARVGRKQFQNACFLKGRPARVPCVARKGVSTEKEAAVLMNAKADSRCKWCESDVERDSKPEISTGHQIKFS